jgi:hypothetical protein
MKTFLSKLSTLRLMNPALRAEFSVPMGEGIPLAYRSGGSIFWR